MAKAPQADPGTNCPLYRKPVEKVCHLCAWYIQVRGKNPQTDKDIDSWGCAIAFGPIMTLEAACQSRSVAAATESLRNETSAVTRATAAVFSRLAEISSAKLRSSPVTELIENK